ncbi:MAG: nitronate monooxygenase, partial [Pseudomonadota bacterium]
MIDACDFLSIDKPVLQGAMGAVARHDLVVAVSGAGGLGTLSYLPPAFFAAEMARIQDSLGKRSFAANLLMPIISKAHVEACLNSDVPIVTVFYGFNQNMVSALKEAGKIVLFQIGSLQEARKVIAAGADGVIVQG